MAYKIPGARAARFRDVLRVSVSALVLFSSANVRAQSQNAASGADANDSFNEITVTARRREENLQSVPIAITALSPQVLRDNNVVQMQDVQSLVPSLAITSGNVGPRESANVSIRGQGYGSISGQPAVAIYLNEVPIITDFDGSLAGGPGMFFDLENLQVLKGPQGTLFGRNTVGGAVLLQSTRPTNEFGGRMQVGVGNYNNREIEGAINIPIVDEKLLFRIAGIAQKRDGFTRALSAPNAPNGIDLDNRNFWGLRGTLSFKPSDNVQHDLIVTNQEYRTNGTGNILTDLDFSTFYFIPTPASGGNPAVPAIYDVAVGRAILAQQQALGPRVKVGNSVDTRGGGSLFAVESITRIGLTDDINIRNLFGFRKAEFDYTADTDGTPFRIFDAVENRYSAQQISNELQLQGKSLGGKLDWIIGGFYADQGPPNRNSAAAPILGIAVFRQPGEPLNVRVQRQLLLNTKAVYGQATYELVDGLRVTGGLRQTWDIRKQGGNGAVGVPFVNSRSASKALTYTLGLDYQVTPDTLLYLASRRGYRAGGTVNVQAGGATRAFSFSPEFVTDYEAGVKSTIDIGSAQLRANANVYYQNYTKIQGNQLIPQGSTFQGVVITEPGGANITQNVGRARVWGAEFEGVLVVNKMIQFGANLAYLDFKYRGFEPGVDVASFESTKTANRIPLSYGLNAQFTVPDDTHGELSLRANYYWQDSFGDFLGSTKFPIPSYGILNLSFNWKDIGGKPFDAQVFISNATNKTYQTGGIGFLGFTERTYGEPRMFGLRLSHRFGAEGK